VRTAREVPSSRISSSPSSAATASSVVPSVFAASTAFTGSRSRHVAGHSPPRRGLRNSTMSSARVMLVQPAMAFVHARPTPGRRKKPARKVPATAPKVFTE